MIIWDDEALILSFINYSETSLILKVFTKKYGVQKGLVKGAKNKNKSSIFEVGNLVRVSYKSRTDEMLGIFFVELIKASSLIYTADVKKFSCVVSIINLIEFSLLENEIELELYDLSKNLIEKVFSIEAGWVEDYIRWEVFLLKKVGFGLELSRCVLSNKKSNLKYISPKSGCAVNEQAALPWKNKLFNLPNFLISDKKASNLDLNEGFKITSHFLIKFANSIDKTLPFTRTSFIDNILINKK